MIVVLAILSGVAIPRYWHIRDQARIGAARRNLAALTDAVQQYRLDMTVTTGGSGGWPTTLDAVLQTRQGEDRINPYRLANQPVYLPDPDNNSAKVHPLVKTVEARMQSQYKGCIWYNNLNGVVRFCIAAQANDAATLELYNQVNTAQVTGLSQTTR